MAGVLQRLNQRFLGSGLPSRARMLRLTATGCITAAVALFIVAGVIAMQQAGQPHKTPLPVGTVFSVAAASPSPAASNIPAATATPRATPPPTSSLAPSALATDALSPTPSPTPSPAPTPPPDNSPVARLVVPAIHVDAPATVKGVDGQGVMQSPNGPNDVAYYDFSGRPGFGSGNNAVFAGHVDYYPHRTAVFWDLDKLRPGDEVRVILQDGATYRYSVTQAVVYSANSAPVQQIVADTPEETVTLITCNGDFAAGEYNNRLVVRAQRIDAPPATPAAGASGG